MVKTSIRIGGHFCRSFVTNLLQHLCAKNYGNIRWFDKVIAKIKMVQTFAHSNVRKFLFYLINLWYFYCVLSK